MASIPQDTSGREATASMALSAVARLERSREALRSALLAPVSDQHADRDATPAGLSRTLQSLPVIGIVVDSLKSWWHQHPARVATTLAGSAAQSVLKPVADRHPVALVVGAAAVGAGIVAVKPWRWGVRPAVLAGLLPPLVASAIGRIPAEAWASILAALIAPGDKSEAPGAADTTVTRAQEWPV